MTPRSLAEDIVRREGGWVDDPDDSGGATNYGVSLRYARGIGLDLDGDGDTDADDIRLVTPDKAVDLYLDDFYYKPRFHRLPEPLHAVIFDMAVNAGPPRALILLQEVLNMVGYDLTEDGVMGPKTRRAAEEAYSMMGEWLINAYVEQRKNFYRSLAARNPSQRKFLRGWLNRAEEFLV